MPLMCVFVLYITAYDNRICLPCWLYIDKLSVEGTGETLDKGGFSSWFWCVLCLFLRWKVLRNWWHLGPVGAQIPVALRNGSLSQHHHLVWLLQYVGELYKILSLQNPVCHQVMHAPACSQGLNGNPWARKNFTTWFSSTLQTLVVHYVYFYALPLACRWECLFLMDYSFSSLIILSVKLSMLKWL